MKTPHSFRRLMAVVPLALALMQSVPRVVAAPGEQERVDLTSTGVIPGATGTAVLRLRINAQGQLQFQASASARNLVPNALFSLCVDGVFVDSDDASQHGRVVLSEDVDVPFTTLLGRVVTIRAGADSCAGTVVLTGTVA